MRVAIIYRYVNSSGDLMAEQPLSIATRARKIPSLTLNTSLASPSSYSTAPLSHTTTTAHEATGMVMEKMNKEWGGMLIRNGAVSAILFALINTYPL